MTWFKENWFKGVIPISILLGSLILGGFFYATQINKQKSIERQQKIELEAKAEQEALKAEQTKKEYLADRKNDCLAIYKTESDKWNNVRGWRYNDYTDECLIRYKEPNPKSEAKCEELYPSKNPDGSPSISLFLERALCKEGEFENSF